MSRRRLGFTLIELLIVVAIIAILAAIAVPNFLDAQMRSKVARVKGDLRTVALAMEAYFVDSDAYPRHADFGTGTPTDQQYWWWSPLTTPVPYMGPMSRDPFQAPFSNYGLSANPYSGGYYHYDPWENTWDGRMADDWGPWIGFVPEMRGRGLWWEISSYGPDGDHDFGAPREGANRFPRTTDKGPGMAVFYDPTNGTVSSGDVIRFGPGASDQIIF